MDSETLKEYTKIASYYYKEGMTQDQIARKMSISRPRVNRIIKKCVELGIVKIEIREIAQDNIDLEKEIEKKFGLKEAVVVEPAENLLESLGKTAARYLEKVLKDNDVIGFSRGRALSALLDASPSVQKRNLSVVQLVGGNNYNQSENFLKYDDIIRRASEVLEAESFFLYAPTVVTSHELKESLLKEESFMGMFERIKKCTVIVVGIGKVLSAKDAKKRSSIAFEDYVKILERKAVGEVCARHFDIEGNGVNGDADLKIMGIEPTDIKKVPLRIGVAGGAEKYEAILGALRGGYINVLILDSVTALRLLE